jgi:hypothetical protein
VLSNLFLRIRYCFYQHLFGVVQFGFLQSSFTVVATKGFLPLILETSHETHSKLAPRERHVPSVISKIVTESGNKSLDLRSVLGLKATEQNNKALGIDFYACARPRVVISASSKLRTES